MVGRMGPGCCCDHSGCEGVNDGLPETYTITDLSDFTITNPDGGGIAAFDVAGLQSYISKVPTYFANTYRFDSINDATYFRRAYPFVTLAGLRFTISEFCYNLGYPDTSKKPQDGKLIIQIAGGSNTLRLTLSYDDFTNYKAESIGPGTVVNYNGPTTDWPDLSWFETEWELTQTHPYGIRAGSGDSMVLTLKRNGSTLGTYTRPTPISLSAPNSDGCDDNLVEVEKTYYMVGSSVLPGYGRMTITEAEFWFESEPF